MRRGESELGSGFGISLLNFQFVSILTKFRIEVAQALGLIQNAFVQIAAVHVEGVRLLVQGLDHIGVTVTHTRHIVVHPHPDSGCPRGQHGSADC